DGRMELDRPAEDAAAGSADAEAVRTPITWVIFLDQTAMQPARRNHALRQLRSFLDRAVGTGDRAMLATIDGQAFRVRQNVTTDRALLLSALARAEKERVHLGPAATEAGAIRRDIVGVGTTDREVAFIARSIAQRISFLMAEEARRTQNAIVAMGALLDVLTRVEGRVALLYVGSGFNTLPASDLVQAWRQVFARTTGLQRHDIPRPEEHQAALEQEVKQLRDRLSASRITFYSISPGETVIVPSDDPGFANVEPTLEGFRAMDGEILDDWGEIRQASVAREMAERTGGLSFRVNPALARQLEAVHADLNDYYSLGYIPKGPSSNTRRIRVRVDVPGARLRHRDSVRERSRWEEAGHDLMAAVVEPPRTIVASPLHPRDPVAAKAVREEANPLGIAVEAERPQRVRGREHLLPFQFNMSLDVLTFVRRKRVHRADLVFHFALAGPDGTLWPIESREQSLEIPRGEVPAKTDQVSYAWHLDLAPLRIPRSVPVRAKGMKLIVSVVDRTSGVRSVVTVPVPRA
ncbi:MAG TPA: VWA domain-containing protein, partial [Thermoanaerobaculia bacterium]|nr:VWA domain-containing protein [Thermoanaerobaculia bacterium]